MAFHFHHRKLFNDSLPDSSVSCAQACEPDGTCLTLHYCLTYCLEVCKTKVRTLNPPPPPPLSPPPPPTGSAADLDKPRQLSLILIAFLAVLAIAFFLFTCYTIYKFYTVWRSSSRRRRQLSQRRHPEEEDDSGDFLDEDQFPVVDHPIWYIRTIGLQPSVISAITIVKYKSADGLVEGTDCAVCLNEFQEDEPLRLLPKCNHAFHISCIDTWLGSHTSCPMCRAGIVKNGAGPLPSQPQEPVAPDSDLREESRSESVSVRIEAPRAAPESETGLEMNEDAVGGDCKVDSDRSDVLQPVRRSVSMDSVSASMISAAVATAFPQQSDENMESQLVIAKDSRVKNGAKRSAVNESLLRLAMSPAIGRSMQSGSSSIKRSASCSAKVFLSRHSSRS